MENAITEILDNNELASALNMAKDIITKDYLYKLEDYEVVDIPDTLKELDIAEYTRIYKFSYNEYILQGEGSMYHGSFC